MASPRKCPACQSMLQTFKMGPIELDRCVGCKGTFFDGGELEGVLGKKVEFKDAGFATSRKCAACSALMRGASALGVQLETCPSCKAVFLDAGELRTLNGGQGVRIREDAKVAKVSFSCAACTTTLDASGALRTNDGFMCLNCAPHVQPHVEDQQALEDVTGWLASLGL
ncbi:MAG: zf-TFIIB domain-containing protein [Myxococcaceae bacterium]